MNKNAAHAVDAIGLGLVRVTALATADCLSLTRGARALNKSPVPCSCAIILAFRGTKFEVNGVLCYYD